MRGKRFSKPKYINDSDMAAAITGPWLLIDTFDNIGFHSVWNTTGTARTITHAATDAVVASTGTWRRDNGAFTAADVGGSFTVAGATNSGNNGTFTILTVVDATHVTTATAGLVNETFGVGVTTSLTQGAPVGVFTYEVTGDGWTDKTNPQPNGQLAVIALSLPTTWSAYFPGGGSDAHKYKMSFNQLDDIWIRQVYTPTSGGGKLRTGASGKAI